MKNAVGREIPDEIAGKKVKPYSGPFSFKPEGRRYAPPLKAVFPGESKVLGSIKEAIKRRALKTERRYHSIIISEMGMPL